MLTSQLSTSLKYAVLLPYIILLIVGMIVPSDGSHGILNIKSLAYAGMFLGFIFYVLLKQRMLLPQWNVLVLLANAVCFLLFWLIVGIFYNGTEEGGAFDQLKILWLTVSVAAISVFYIREKLISFQTILKTVIIANFTYSFIKVTFITLYVLGFIDFWTMMNNVGFRFMSMDILAGIPRFQTSMDILTPFLLFFFLQAKNYDIRWSKLFRFIYLTVSACAIFLSFSRFLTFAAFLSIFFHVCTLSRFKILINFILFILACVCGLFIIGIDNVSAIIEKRLLSNENSESDARRVEQSTVLLEKFYDHPLLGSGMGSYVENAYRDENLRYSYEVQWLANLMQFGLLGLMLMIFPLYLISAKILSPPLSRRKCALFLLFVSWLLAGFTNPFLYSLSSGILYLLFYAAGDEITEAVPCKT